MTQRNAAFSHPVDKKHVSVKPGIISFVLDHSDLAVNEQKTTKIDRSLQVHLMYKVTRQGANRICPALHQCMVKLKGTTSESAHSEMPGDSWPRKQRKSVMEAPNLSD